MNKANLRGLLTEATSAEEEIVLSDETTAVTTSTAMYDEKNEKRIPATRTRTIFTRMSVIKARHVFYSKLLDSDLNIQIRKYLLNKLFIFDENQTKGESVAVSSNFRGSELFSDALIMKPSISPMRFLFFNLSKKIK